MSGEESDELQVRRNREEQKEEKESHQIRINGKEGKREITQKTKLDGELSQRKDRTFVSPLRFLETRMCCIFHFSFGFFSTP
jgi:hypothetical protein